MILEYNSKHKVPKVIHGTSDEDAYEEGDQDEKKCY